MRPGKDEGLFGWERLSFSSGRQIQLQLDGVDGCTGLTLTDGTVPFEVTLETDDLTDAKLST